jgi:hypothetical protein
MVVVMLVHFCALAMAWIGNFMLEGHTHGGDAWMFAGACALGIADAATMAVLYVDINERFPLDHSARGAHMPLLDDEHPGAVAVLLNEQHATDRQAPAEASYNAGQAFGLLYAVKSISVMTVFFASPALVRDSERASPFQFGALIIAVALSELVAVVLFFCCEPTWDYGAGSVPARLKRDETHPLQH